MHRSRFARASSCLLLFVIHRGKTLDRLFLCSIGALRPYPLVTFVSSARNAVLGDPLIQELDDSSYKLLIRFEVGVVGDLDPFLEECDDLLPYRQSALPLLLKIPRRSLKWSTTRREMITKYK